MEPGPGGFSRYRQSRLRETVCFSQLSLPQDHGRDEFARRRIFSPEVATARTIRMTGTKPFVVMYHGSLVERNGLAFAVEAFAKSAPVDTFSRAQDLRFSQCVSGPRDGNRQRTGLKDSVRYLGPKPLEEIVDAIEACSVGIIPNQRSIFTELNTPTRIFEYLALGKPVIAPDAPGITDYFDEESLIFFELGNADDLARKIEYVFHNPAEVPRSDPASKADSSCPHVAGGEIESNGSVSRNSE